MPPNTSSPDDNSKSTGFLGKFHNKLAVIAAIVALITAIFANFKSITDSTKSIVCDISPSLKFCPPMIDTTRPVVTESYYISTGDYDADNTLNSWLQKEGFEVDPKNPSYKISVFYDTNSIESFDPGINDYLFYSTASPISFSINGANHPLPFQIGPTDTLDKAQQVVNAISKLYQTKILENDSLLFEEIAQKITGDN